MSTEQQPSPATAPKSEPNALASGLTSGWDQFKQGKLISYPLMALILIVVTVIGVGWWILAERRKAESARWVELKSLTTVADLEEYAKKYPNTIQAKIANLEIARIHIGPEGIERMAVREQDVPTASAEESARKARELRATAVANVEKARDEFARLVDAFQDYPAMRLECMFACAKAEAVLIGVPKEGQVEQFRGDPAKAIELLDRVSQTAPDTDWGKDAKKLADALRNQNTKEQVQTLQTSMFDVSPTLPKFPSDPKMPKDPFHGSPSPP
jgi:hypothetical protein